MWAAGDRVARVMRSNETPTQPTGVRRYMRDMARLLFSWFKRVASWLARAWLAALTLAVVVIGVWFPLAMRTESAIRLSGLILQLLGLAAAAFGIRNTRRMFGKPSFLQHLRNWAASVPRLKPKTQNISVSGSISVGASVSATVWHNPATGASLEQRVAAMEANLKELEHHVRMIDISTSNNERAFANKLCAESDERVRHDHKLFGRVEAASTDGLHLAAAGAFLLAAGVILSTASNEILRLVGN